MWLMYFFYRKQINILKTMRTVQHLCFIKSYGTD